jgi:hypothetical protein
MEIKHTVMPTNAEVKELFDVVANAYKASYGTAERQNAAVMVAEHTFCQALANKLAEAFDLGYKVGAAHANVKDDEMYKL